MEANKTSKKQYYIIFLCSAKYKECDYVYIRKGNSRDWKSKFYTITFNWIGSIKISKIIASKIKNKTVSKNREYILRGKCFDGFQKALFEKGYVNAEKLSQSFESRDVNFLLCEEFTEEEVKENISAFIQQYHTVTSTKRKVRVNLAEEITTNIEKIDWVKKEGDWIVYQHISPNGKSYIGITQQDPEKRWQNGKGYIGQKKFYNAIKKYGWDSFQHNILKENICEEAASYWEKYYIKEFDSYYNGYNATEGGLYER